MFSIAGYVVGLVVCWLVGVVFMFFAGRNKESIAGEDKPKFMLGALLFTVIGVIPGANLAFLAAIPLLIVYTMAYVVGRASGTFKVSFNKE
jgi:xanthine/uracil permease